MENKINEGIDNLCKLIVANSSDLVKLSDYQLTQLKYLAINSQNYDAATLIRDEQRMRIFEKRS